MIYSSFLEQTCCVRMEVLTAVLLKIAVFWGVMGEYLLNYQWIAMPSSSASSDTNALSHADGKTEVLVFNLWSVVCIHGIHGLLHAAIYLNTGAGHAALHTAISRNLVDIERVALCAFLLHNIVSS
jgi:hypothetical protein